MRKKQIMTIVARMNQVPSASLVAENPLPKARRRPARVRRTAIFLFAAFAILLASACNGKLTVAIDGKGSVKVFGVDDQLLSCSEPSCEFEVPNGSALTLQATPGKKGVFQTWSGDCIGPKKKCELTADGDKSVKARFIEKFKAVVTVVGGGRVQSEDGRIDCPDKACEASYSEGEEMRLRRQGGKDVFDAYSGDCTLKECILIVKKDIAVTATFSVPAGRTISGGTLAAGAGKKPLVGMAFDDEGGWAVVALAKRQAHVVRYSADGKKVYSTTKKVGTATYPPAVGFFGDDLILLAATDTSTTVARLSPDGKTMLYNRLLRGCPALTLLEITADAAFAAGAFGGDGLSCGERELIPSGETDIVVARLAVEDGGITWVSQFGSKTGDSIAALAVSRSEDTWVAYNAGDRAGRLVHLNPAGKAFPEIKFGASNDTQVLDVKLQGPYVNVSGHVYAVVDFGAGHQLGVAAKDGAGRVVWVQMDEDGRHKNSKLVARSRCGDGWMCDFGPLGGFARIPLTSGSVDGETPKRRRGKKKKKARGTIRMSLNRLGDDGAERWSGRLRGSGFAKPALVKFGPGGNVFIVGSLEGELSLTGRVSRLKASSPSIFWVQLKG